MEFFDLGTIATIISAILIVVSAVFGSKYKAVKNTFDQIDQAIEDDKVSKEELKKIWRQAKKIVEG